MFLLLKPLTKSIFAKGVSLGVIAVGCGDL